VASLELALSHIDNAVIPAHQKGKAMVRKPVFPSSVRYLIDVVIVIAVVLLALLLGRRTPGDDVWNYMDGLLFLVGILLNVGGAYAILWAGELIVHEPQAIKEKPDLSNASAVITTLGLLGSMFIGACAILALYMHWTTDLVTGFLHLVHLSDTQRVDQLLAERSGIAALIVVLIVTVFFWLHSEWYHTGSRQGTHPGGTRPNDAYPSHPTPPHYSDDTAGLGNGGFLEDVLHHEKPEV
jgi:hypothetical protein